MAADQFRFGEAEPVCMGLIDEQVAQVRPDAGDEHGHAVGNEAQVLLPAEERLLERLAPFDFPFQIRRPLVDEVFHPPQGLQEVLFGLPARPVVLRFGKGPLDSRHETAEATLHDVILGAAGEDLDGPLFADRAGHEDERCIGPPPFRLGEGQGARIAGQVIVGKDQIGGVFIQMADKVFLRRHKRGFKPDIPFLQFEADQSGVEGIVLQHEDADRLLLHEVPPADLRMRCPALLDRAPTSR